MHDPRIMIRDSILVVIIRTTSIGKLIRVKQRATIERRSESRDDRIARLIGAGGEWAGGAGEDVLGAGCGESSCCSEGELAVGDAPGKVTGRGLRVDGHVRISEL